MSKAVEVEYVPNHDIECENCGQTPTVSTVEVVTRIKREFRMCGPCVFGEAACIDPEEW